MADYLEIEQKFDVDEDFVQPDAEALRDGIRAALGAEVTVAEPVRYRLSATYYDTADQRLAASKITLRRRLGGADAGWHLKLPAGLGARRELREPLSDGPVPHRLASAVAEVAGGLPLAPIAVLDTERLVVTLTGDARRLLAEIADDLVTARRLAAPAGAAIGEPGDAGGRSPWRLLRWREIEVELPEAWPELQRAVADLLLAAGARPAGHGSKLARVLEELRVIRGEPAPPRAVVAAGRDLIGNGADAQRKLIRYSHAALLWTCHPRQEMCTPKCPRVSDRHG